MKTPAAVTVTVPLAGSVVLLQTLPPSPEGVSLEARLAVNGVSSVTPTGCRPRPRAHH
ncbi:MAG: hypothetical protein IPF71_08980 [Rhodoferax sp.]|nr:hypothetical protein [Rhodoferax sp.]